MIMIALAPVIEAGQKLLLDVKFVEGMRLHKSLWDGPITCVLRRGATSMPFGAEYDRRELGFDLEVIDADAGLDSRILAGQDLILASGDDYNCLGLVDHVKPS